MTRVVAVRYTLEVEVRIRDTNETDGDSWVPSTAKVAEVIADRVVGWDPDTGWRITDVVLPGAEPDVTRPELTEPVIGPFLTTDGTVKTVICGHRAPYPISGFRYLCPQEPGHPLIADHAGTYWAHGDTTTDRYWDGVSMIVDGVSVRPMRS